MPKLGKRYEVTVEVRANSSGFDCPDCGRYVGARCAYPLDFRYRKCPGCGVVWSNLMPQDLRHHDDLGIGPADTIEICGHPA